ncbi:hypothetical protein BJX63DRAFT_19998 [Aspergillus granulosus]|uniref:Uncharacterized protein n=1 Tax=Aspergillus granulosus TaxID=176169 RepID=A0ABR4H048_9EURO
MQYPWHALATWAPFAIDALGLITLLGAEEVNAAVGRLAPSLWLEYMPLLAGFVFAADRHRAKQATFTLYNVSSGIVTGNLAGWFTRWMQAQEFEAARSVVYWEVEPTAQTRWKYQLVSTAVSVTCMGLLLVLTVLSGDWYGFTNAVAIVVLISTRAYLVQMAREAIDTAVAAARPLPATFSGALNLWQARAQVDPAAAGARPQRDGQKWRPEHAKIIVVMPNSQAVTMFIPEHLLRPIFVTDTTPGSPALYRLVRWAGWVAFTVHVVTLGMAMLATQLYIIAIMVASTVLTCYGWGCDDSRLAKWWRAWRQGEETPAQPYLYRAGLHLTATVFEWPQDMEFARDSMSGAISRRYLSKPIPPSQRSKARMDLYAWLNLSVEEEKSLWDWHLLPHPREHDDSWWRDFREKQALVRDDPWDIQAIVRGIRDSSSQTSSTPKSVSSTSTPIARGEKGDLGVL